MERLPIVGVMGSREEPHTALAAPLGALLAGRRVHLLTGGGGGVMRAVAQAFVEAQPPGGRAGLSLGVLPALDPQNPALERPDYPNAFVEIAIRTHLPASSAAGPLGTRNPVNILSSDVVIVLPGGRGTRMEADLAVEYGRRVIGYGWSSASGGAPAGLRVCASLGAVEAFLADALGAVAGGGSG